MTTFFRQSPLPFQGQKRNFVTTFARELAALPDDTIFVDLFGGSGLLSRTAKTTKPQSRVVYNDFDDFHLRIAAIPTTNAIVAEIRAALADVPKFKRVPDDIRTQLLETIAEFDRAGFVDYISISSALLFSGRYATELDQLRKSEFYNSVRLSDYPDADDYLDGLELRKLDYKVLFAEFKDNPRAFFICDPPYLSTSNEVYKCYWQLTDFLDVMDCLQGTRFAYFTSDKSSLVELVEWIERHYRVQSPFFGAKRFDFKATINKQSGYKDTMFFKAY